MRTLLLFFYFLAYTISISSYKLPNKVNNIPTPNLSSYDTVKKSRLDYYTAGKLYAEKSLNTEAIKRLNSALKAANSKDTLTILIKNKIGNVYFSMKNLDIAREYFNTALQDAIALKFKREQANSLAYLGTIEEKEHNYLKALQFQQQSLTVFSSINHKLGIAEVNLNIGSIHEDLNQFNKAYKYFYTSYQLLKNSNSYLEADVVNNLGDIFRKQGKIDNSISYSEEALRLAQKLNNSNLLEAAYKDLSKAYFKKKEFEKAYNLRVQSEKFKEITLKNQNAKQLNILQSEYEYDRKETEIQLLKERNKVNNSNQQLLIVTLVGLAFLILIFSYFYWKRIKAKQMLQEYEQLILKAELEKKEAQEKTLQNDIQLKTVSLSKYSLHLSEKNKMLTDVSSHLKKTSIRNNIDFRKKLNTISKEIDFRLKQEAKF